MSNWTTNSIGNFDWLGNLMLTNAIDSATPQRDVPTFPSRSESAPYLAFEGIRRLRRP